jgi:Flp pilus assembly CpaF family ATPase
MKEDKMNEVILRRYKCVNEGTVFVEFLKDYICVNWSVFNDRAVNKLTVRQICLYIKRNKEPDDNRPVMDALCHTY